MEQDSEQWVDPCSLCRTVAEMDRKLAAIPSVSATIITGLKQVKKGSCEQWALKEVIADVESIRQPFSLSKDRALKKHSKCRGCHMLFGPGHEAQLTDHKRGFCQRCVQDLSRYGEAAFISGP